MFIWFSHQDDYIVKPLLKSDWGTQLSTILEAVSKGQPLFISHGVFALDTAWLQATFLVSVYSKSEACARHRRTHLKMK